MYFRRSLAAAFYTRTGCYDANSLTLMCQRSNVSLVVSIFVCIMLNSDCTRWESATPKSLSRDGLGCGSPAMAYTYSLILYLFHYFFFFFFYYIIPHINNIIIYSYNRFFHSYDLHYSFDWLVIFSGIFIQVRKSFVYCYLAHLASAGL